MLYDTTVDEHAPQPADLACWCRPMPFRAAALGDRWIGAGSEAIQLRFRTRPDSREQRHQHLALTTRQSKGSPQAKGQDGHD